jgi:hypothetical protein
MSGDGRHHVIRWNVEQLNGCGQFDACLCPLASLGKQGTESQVAMGLEWTHPEFLGESEGLLIVTNGVSL